MKLFVTAKPGAKKECVEQIDATNFVISVCEQPEKGKANIAILKALAAYLGISSSALALVSGFHSRRKVFEIQK